MQLVILDQLDQLEQVIVNKKGKLLKAWIWSQIQTLTKKLQALWLRNNTGSQKKNCCRKSKKDDPSNGNGVAVKRKLDFNSSGEFNVKDQHNPKRKMLLTDTKPPTW